MNKIFLTFFLLWQSVSALTQSFHGGIIVGLNAAQIDGDLYSGFDKAGAQGGVFVTHPVYSSLEARMEIKYSARGARNPASDDNTGYYKLSLHYIDIPFMLGAKIKQKATFELGLVPGYLFATGGADDSGKLPDEYLIEFNRFDLGILGGLSYALCNKIALNFRYTYSLLSIRHNSATLSSNHQKGADYNNYLSCSISYQFK
jgi:hypothetical protein